MARPTASAGIWADQSSWLTGFTPEALIAVCMSVATVPGLKPITRMPLSRYSLSRQRVSESTAAFEAQ
jgi:hypothetical protein